VTTAQDGGKVVSLTHRPPLYPGNAPGTHFCYRLSRPQGQSAIGRILCQWKSKKPAIFRFVAQHLNHSATAVPGNKCASVNSKISQLLVRFMNKNNCSHKYALRSIAHTWQIILNYFWKWMSRYVCIRIWRYVTDFFPFKTQSHLYSSSTICVSWSALSISKLYVAVNITNFISHRSIYRNIF